MSYTSFLDEKQKQILAQARETYGDSIQILVSNEELCELAAVCAKYPRYKDPVEARAALTEKALDEVADVLIVLDHIINIFGLSDYTLKTHMATKVNRLQRWLSTSKDIEQTTKDRSLEESPQPEENIPCETCVHFKVWEGMVPCFACRQCVKNKWCNYTPKEG